MKKYYVIYVRNGNHGAWYRLESHDDKNIATDRAVNHLPKFFGFDNIKIEHEYC